MDTILEPIELVVSHRGTQHRLSLLPTDTVALLQARLEELTSVPPSLQKLLFKGKKSNLHDSDTLAQAGLKHGTKVQMLGSTTEELGRTLAAENEHQRKERIMRERALKAPVQVCESLHEYRNVADGRVRSAPLVRLRLRPPSIPSTASNRLLTSPNPNPLALC